MKLEWRQITIEMVTPEDREYWDFVDPQWDLFVDGIVARTVSITRRENELYEVLALIMVEGCQVMDTYATCQTLAEAQEVGLKVYQQAATRTSGRLH
jgi:hypothetical protein